MKYVDREKKKLSKQCVIILVLANELFIYAYQSKLISFCKTDINIMWNKFRRRLQIGQTMILHTPEIQQLTMFTCIEISSLDPRSLIISYLIHIQKYMIYSSEKINNGFWQIASIKTICIWWENRGLRNCYLDMQ